MINEYRHDKQVAGIVDVSLYELAHNHRTSSQVYLVPQSPNRITWILILSPRRAFKIITGTPRVNIIPILWNGIDGIDDYQRVS